jgi:hypothetical protein
MQKVKNGPRISKFVFDSNSINSLPKPECHFKTEILTSEKGFGPVKVSAFDQDVLIHKLYIKPTSGGVMG